MIYNIVTKIYESSLIINSKSQVIVKNVVNYNRWKSNVNIAGFI